MVYALADLETYLAHAGDALDFNAKPCAALTLMAYTGSYVTWM